MNSKITKIIRRTVTHSCEEYPSVIDVIQRLGYRIVYTIPNELSADGRESDALVTIAEREEYSD